MKDLQSSVAVNMAALNHIKNSAQHYSVWESVTKVRRAVKTHLEFAKGHNCGPCSCDVGNYFVDRLNQDVIVKLCESLTKLTLHTSKSLLLHVVTKEHHVRAMRL